MDAEIQVIGNTTPPEGCENFQVRILSNRSEPIEVVGGCLDFKVGAREARELAVLLQAAADRVEGV